MPRLRRRNIRIPTLRELLAVVRNLVSMGMSVAYILTYVREPDET